MILLFLTVLMNRKDTGRRVTWLVPLISTFIFGFMMFAPITNGGYITLENRNNVSDTLEYDYEITTTDVYFETLLINFAFFLFSALITLYSAFMSPVEEIIRMTEEVTR